MKEMISEISNKYNVSPNEIYVYNNHIYKYHDNYWHLMVHSKNVVTSKEVYYYDSCLYKYLNDDNNWVLNTMNNESVLIAKNIYICKGLSKYYYTNLFNNVVYMLNGESVNKYEFFNKKNIVYKTLVF